MPTETGLTREQKDTLTALGVRPIILNPLINGGCSLETAYEIATTRLGRNPDATRLADDIALLSRLEDPALLLQIVTADYASGPLRYTMVYERLAVDQIREAVNLGIDPNHIADWVEAGNAVSDLVEPLKAAAGVEPKVVVSALLLSITPADLVWLAGTPTGVKPEVLHYLRVDGTVDGGVAAKFAAVSVGHRRLVLMLISAQDFTAATALALGAAVGDTPWTDTLIQLVADGTPAYDAVEIARADHHLELTRTRSIARGTGTTAADGVIRGPVRTGPVR
jgi:hypothetical protein